MPGVDRRLIQNFEWPLLGLALALAAIGVVNLVSAAPGPASGLPPTALRQLLWLGLGLLGMLTMLVPDYRSLERLALPAYACCALLLVAVLLFGPVINGSQRWLVFGSFARVQPSELAKLAIPLVLARFLHRRLGPADLRLHELAVPVLLIALPVLLVLRQPDLGTAMVLALLGGTYLFFARVPARTLAWLGAAGVAAASVAWLFVLREYQKERILTFLDPERDPLGAAYHAIQSQIAVGSGGLLGKGFLRGPQSQLDFLPEQQTDFVFSVLAEEWGFLGGGLVLLLYLVMLVRGLMIARASKDGFGCYLALGVVGLLFWPCAVNVAMVVGLLPVVGIPLPFLSYGGSALVTCLLGVGLLMNISMRRYLF
jgi:rod shape determining protein RodA